MTVEATRSRSTDQILDQALEDSGNHDPTRIRETKDRSIHYDAYSSLDAMLEEHHTGEHAAHFGVEVAVKIAETAVEHASRIGGGIACGAGAIIMMASLGNSALRHAWIKADERLAQGASDAGVVAAANVLDFDPEFKAQVNLVHGSTRAGEKAAAQLRNDAHKGDRALLQKRAYEGFDKAAGYALEAAKKMAPIGERIAVATRELAAAEKSGDKKAAERLRAEIGTLANELHKLEKLYFAPIAKDIHGDAAVGLGAQYALFHALKVARGEETLEQFQAIHAKASAATMQAMADPRDSYVRNVLA